jgi:hypothetical protein
VQLAFLFYVKLKNTQIFARSIVHFNDWVS